MDDVFLVNELKGFCELFDIVSCSGLLESFVGVFKKCFEELSILCVLEDKVD